MRRKSLFIVACVTLLVILSTTPADAQRRHRGGHHPYYMGFSQWYPYPGLGFPPIGGFFPGDHFSSLRFQIPQCDAIIYVDGFAAGIVDDFDGVFQRLQLVPGHHEIVVFLPGYRTLRQNLYLNPRSTHNIRHTLTPLAPGEAEEPQPVPRAMPPMAGMPAPQAPTAEAARTGVLAIRVQPVDASIYIDGEPWRGPRGQERLVVQLGEGSHRVRVEKPGFQSFSVDIDVRAGETTSFNVSLVQ